MQRKECLLMAGNFELFTSFARISASTFGGGYAMLPFFQRELVQKKGWLTDVNTATFCGYRTKGLAGAVFATLGVLTPPILIVLVISAFFWSFAENPWVAHALVGVRACVCALIASSTVKLFRKAVLDAPTLLVFAAVFVLAAFVGVTPALLVVGAGLFGLALYQVRQRKGEQP